MWKETESILKERWGRRDFLKLVGAGAVAGGLALNSPIRKAIAATAPKEPFKLAIVAFTTGPATSYGLPGHEMLDLLVPLWNSKGGILGRKIELSKYDEGAVANVVETFKKLTKQDEVDAILGCASSASALASAPIAEDPKQSSSIVWPEPTK